jgi:hypothetical protein
MPPSMALFKPMLTGFASKWASFVAPIWTVLTCTPFGLSATSAVLAQALPSSWRMLPEKAPRPPAYGDDMLGQAATGMH